MEPHNLKPSYLKFLARVTGGKLNMMNRDLFSVYGAGSNLAKNTMQELDSRFTSEAMKKVLEMRAKMGAGSELMKEIVSQVITGH